MSHLKWTVTLEQDLDTGEAILPLPDDIISQLGWTEGTIIYWIDNKNGTFTLTDKEEDVISS